MKNKLKRFMSLFLACLTLMNTFGGFITSTVYAASKVEDDFIGSQILLVDKGNCGRLLTYNDEEIQAKFVMYEGTDGKEYPAYCNEPSWQGVGSNGISYGEYVIKSKVTDDRLWRVATAGFPYKTPSEMGVNGEREAFMATKMAIYRTLDDEDLNLFGSLNSEGENMIEVIKELYDIGLNGTGGYVEPELTITPETNETVLDENDPQYKSQVFRVEGNCEFEEYEVIFDLEDLPDGTKITDIDGIEQTTFDSDEKFKVMIPVNENSVTAFKLNVRADLKSNVVYHAECENIRMQTMLIAANPYETVTTDVTVKLNKTVANITIIKKDSVTDKGLANTVFEVNKIDGEIVGTYTTDKNGEVVVSVNEAGYYKIREIEAPEGYLLSENAEQIINVQFNITNTATFLNDKKAGLEIVKIDKDSGKPLENARYRVSLPNGTIIGEYTTNSKGTINIQDLLPAWYDVEEIQAPTNYLKDTKVHKIEIVENEVTTLTLTNKKLTGIQIIKKDSLTEKPLANATFEVTLLNSDYSDKTYIGDFTTDESGTVTIQHLVPGMYGIKEIKAPRGYNIDTETKLIEVTINNDAIVELTNTMKAGIQIKKVDLDTGKPLANARFRITNVNGQSVGEFTTSRTGFINVPELEAGFYIIEETLAPEGYLLDNTPKTVEVRENAPTVVEFANQQKGGIQILKVDAVTGAPLANAKFRVTLKNGAVIGEYTTDKEGHINLPNLENGWYTILEIEAPKGYILDDVKQDVEVTGYNTKIVEFVNRPKSGLQIKKVDFETGEPLADATFRVSTIKGKLVGEYTTGKTGFINLGELDEGYYLIEEIAAPDGYALNETVKTVEVKSNEVVVATFENKQLGGIQILKKDEATGLALKNAKFKVTTKTGEFIGEYTTDTAGSIVIPNLKAGWYTITETEAPKGYLLDGESYDIEVKYYKNSVLEVTNKAKAGIQILKLDSVTKQGLKGVKFKVSKINGEYLGTYTTDASGMIYITDLNEGWYIVQEISTIDGYKLDSTPRNVEVKSNVATVIEFENEPYSTLIIQKIDSVTGKTIAGVKFHITKENGEYVGDFTTDSFGQIKFSKTLTPDTYIIEETTSADGYKVDSTIQKVTLKWGETKLVQVKNQPYGSLKIVKVDKDTNATLQGVEFKLVKEDTLQSWKLSTDRNGEIFIDRTLEAGTYLLSETKALSGYELDKTEREVVINWGKTTTLKLTNEKIKGKIQIVKTSLDNNKITGALAGTKLANAVYEIRNENNKVVETIKTNSEGIAISKELDYGIYKVKEKTAPNNYVLDEKEYVVKIGKDNRLQVLNLTNKSVDVNVTIEKTGVTEAQCLDVIRYDFKNIKNNSNVALTNFTWHDSLPIETTLQKVYTGTWSQNLNYSVKYKTNFSSEYKLMKDNLFTTQVYELDFSSLPLQRDERVTDIIFDFGTVNAGFTQVEAPFMFVKINNYLKDKTEIVNYTEVYGFLNTYKVTGNSFWKTIIFNKTLPIVKIPKTGW